MKKIQKQIEASFWQAVVVGSIVCAIGVVVSACHPSFTIFDNLALSLGAVVGSFIGNLFLNRTYNE